MEAADRAAGPAQAERGVATADRTAEPPVAHQIVPATPVLAVPATARLTVAAARHASPRVTLPTRRAQSPAPAPVRRPDHVVVTAAAPPPIAPAGGRREYVAHVTLVQVVCWQVAVFAVVLAAGQPLPVLVGVSAAAAALLALTAVRIDGRWLHERGALAAGYLCRTRRRALPEDGGRVPALLDLLVPGCAVRSMPAGDGPVMTISHRGGVTVVLRPAGADVPSPRELLSLVDGQQGTLAVQTVCHAGPRRDGPAQVLLLAVHAVRGVDVPGDDELALVLRNAVRRARRALHRAGVPAEPLTEAAGSTLVAGLAHVTGGGSDVREGWRFWRTGGVCQATFALRGWHRLTDARAGRLVADLFTATAGVAVTVTVSARSTAGGPRVEGVLRLAATTEVAVEAASAAAAVRAGDRGIRLVRLDGAHSRGVAASLPIGVFLT